MGQCETPSSGNRLMPKPWIAGLMFALIGTSARADEPLVDAVRAGIEKGVRFLRNQERGRGSWEHLRGSIALPGGCTCLATLALLNSGVKKEDAIIQRALTYLRDLKPDHTYVVSLQTMVFAEIADARDGPLIERNVQWLISARVFRNGKLHGWGYSQSTQLTDFS